MKIEEVKKLDNGVSGITIEGKIIKTPKPPGDSEYGWSQMIILKDDTGEMGSWINIENAENAYKVGQYIKVQGKVSKYMKGGKPGISLNNGKVVEEITKVEKVSQEQPKDKTVEKPVEKTQPKMTQDDYWREKTLRDIENNKCIVRECAIKAVTELANVDIDLKGVKSFDDSPLIVINTEKEYFKFADKIVDYIYKLTSEDITKEFGGTKEEEEMDKVVKKLKEEKTKTTKKTKETEKTTETEEEDWATEKQVALIKKNIVTSHLLTEPEKKKIEDFLKDGLTKTKAGEIICWWLGDIVEDIKGQRSIRGEKEKEDSTKADKADKADKEEKIKKARTIVKAHGSVEVKDKTAPFPDEDIPGSSPKNAIKFKKKGDIPF